MRETGRGCRWTKMCGEHEPAPRGRETLLKLMKTKSQEDLAAWAQPPPRANAVLNGYKHTNEERD